MSARVLELPASSTLRPEQALADALEYDWDDVMVLGYVNGGELFWRTSRMSRKDVLWLIEMMKAKVLEMPE